jgi:hypothetical protein
MNQRTSRRRVLLASAGLVGAAVGSGLVPSRAWAQAQVPETRVTQADQTSVAVTIYNENLALVKDRRRVTLPPGIQNLAFIDVSAQLRPETALLHSDGGQLGVLEQNFEFDLLTPEKLLEDSVGETVKVVRTNPVTGAETVEDARILSVANGLVLKIGDRIETAYPGRVVFDRVPARLRARPTLVLELQNANPSEQQDEKTMDLSGWVTLTNTSGSSYNDAKLQLVAGNVNQVQPMMEQAAKSMTMATNAAAPPMAQEELFEYHLYTLGRPTTIGDNQTKQVAMLSGAGIPVTKEYRLVNIGTAYNYALGDMARVNATVRMAFDNKEADHLGLPLPKGTVRVYKNDSSGQALFVGEDAIDHTPKGETIHLDLGQAFDVTAQPKQTEFEQLSDRVFEAAFEIEVKNAKKEPVTVTVAEQFPAQWKMIDESLPHQKVQAFQAEWQVPVPAEGKTTLKYRVRVTF